MTDATDIAAIAKGLTKAQAAAVLSATEISGQRWWCVNAGRVAAHLYSVKIAYPAIPDFAWRSARRNVMLTPLGLAVRALLISQETEA